MYYSSISPIRDREKGLNTLFRHAPSLKFELEAFRSSLNYRQSCMGIVSENINAVCFSTSHTVPIYYTNDKLKGYILYKC